MRRLITLVAMFGVLHLGVAPASASTTFWGTLHYSLTFRFTTVPDGVGVRLVNVGMTWRNTNVRVLSVLYCGRGTNINNRIATSYGSHLFVSMAVRVPEYYPRCELTIRRYSGAGSTQYYLNIYGRNLRRGSFLSPADQALRDLELDAEIESMQLDEVSFAGPLDDLRGGTEPDSAVIGPVDDLEWERNR